MANRWGNNGNRDFFGGGSKKSLQMVTAAMKLKDACSLEGKLDLGSIPGSGRSSGEGNGNPLHILAWRISWAEEPGELLVSKGSQRVGHDGATSTVKKKKSIRK